MYIPVDVGENGIERETSMQQLFVAQQHLDTVGFIEAYIFFGIFVSPFVYIDCRNMFGVAHAGEYGENCCPASHVENMLTLEIMSQYPFEHKRCRFMMACPECHFGIDDYFVTNVGYIGMECTVYYAFVIDDDRLEIVFFPFLVPVLVGKMFASPVDFCIDRQIVDNLLQSRFGIFVFGNIGADTCCVGHKTVISGFGQQSGNDIGNQ